MTTVISCLILCSLVILYFLLSFHKQKQLLQLLNQKSFEKLHHEFSSFWTRILMPKYNLEYIKLNCYLMERNKNQIDAQFEKLFPLKKSSRQQEDLLRKSFEYYLETENKMQCEKILDLMDHLDIKQEAQMMFDILLDKKADYIDFLLEKTENCTGENKAVCYTLVAQQYANISDKDSKRKYQTLAKNVLKSNM